MRGVTPVLAVVILLLITVSAAGAAFIWINTVQAQIATESQSGLETNLQRIHGQVSIEAVWNESTQVCFTIRNSGTISYTEAQMNLLSVYVRDSPYRYNATVLYGMGSFRPSDFMNLCVCTPAQASSTDCVGPVPDGFAYAGGTVDIRVEPSVGTGDLYTFRGST